jgi:hypothetical protein
MAGSAGGDEKESKPKNESVASTPLAKLQKLTEKELFEAFSKAARDGRRSRFDADLSKDFVLTEMIRRAGPKCEEFLKKQFEASKKVADHFDGQNLELLTALRRIQNKPDPVTVDVTLPRDLQATTRSLPKIQVALKNVDKDESPVVIAFGGDYRSGRLARWRFEVRDSKGNILPQRETESMAGGGMYGIGQLAYGKSWKASLSMENYVRIKEPGEYTVRILYHDEETIADLDDVKGLITCVSKPFKLKIGKAVPKIVTVPAGSRKRALALVAALPENGMMRVVMGTYGPDYHKFISPKSPQGQLQAMGWDAVAGMLEALRDDKLTSRRRGWVLAMLFIITGERDLNPFSWRKWNEVLPAYEYRGPGCTGSGGGSVSVKEQRELSDLWLKLQPEAWDFREDKK